jgi:hypothetical protein
MSMTCNQQRGRLATLLRTIVASAIGTLGLIGTAWAYLDPGTGWMIVQGFIAALAAAGVALGTYWTRVRSWFSRGSKHGGEGASPSKPDQE